MKKVEARVRKAIAEVLGLREGSIGMGDSFTNSLGADSLDEVELIMRLETEFGIEISDEDAARMKCPAQVVKHIKKKLDISENEEDLKNILRTASARTIREVILGRNFHKIKHTASFSILVSRLAEAERKIDKFSKMTEKYTKEVLENLSEKESIVK